MPNFMPIPTKFVKCQKCGKSFSVKQMGIISPKHCWSCSNKWEKLRHLVDSAIVS